jgi:4-hydroxybenzoate polyprenyltransferase
MCEYNSGKNMILIKPSWISLLPRIWQPYAHLARLDKPAGFMLLVFPAWWAQILATPHGTAPNFFIFVLFFIGAVVMRAAGCAINDAMDYKLDAQVERTRLRPIARGEISPRSGILFAVACCILGLVIVMQMGNLSLWLSVLSLPLIAAYPLMKRITWWPQAFLGIVFNWGAMMGFAAVQGSLPLHAFLLYAACFFWTLAYDTIYAFQDIEDDVAAGIKSTAQRVEKNTILAWSGLCILLLLMAGFYAGLGPFFYAGMMIATLQLIFLLKQWRANDTASCLAAFQGNVVFGFIVLAAMLLGRII